VVFVFDDLDAGGGAVDDLLVAVEGDEREGDGLVQRVEKIAVVGDAEEDRLGIDIDGGTAADGPAGLVEDGRIEGRLQQPDILKDIGNVVVSTALPWSSVFPCRTFLSKSELWSERLKS
jgi:hypothetical protein